MMRFLPAFAAAAVCLGNHANAQISFTATPLSGCPPLAVNFTNTTTDPQATQFYWTFGDGNSLWTYDTSTVPNPSHTYTNPGGYWAYLDAYDATSNWINAHSEYIQVEGSSGNFYSSPGDSACPGDQINFWSNDNASSYNWDFGDGISGQGSNVYHAYGATGNFFVRLILNTACGTDTVYDTIRVTGTIQPPQAGFGFNPNPVCPGQQVNYNPWYGGYQYKWLFGDGDSSMLEYPYHSYASLGKKYITLQLTNGCGNSSFHTDSILVDPNQPVPNWVNLNVNAGTVCPGQQVNMNASCCFKAYVWDYGDGSPTDSSDQDYRYYTYTAAGTYYPTVTIYNECGNDTTLMDSIVVSTTAGFAGSGLNLNINNSPACPNSNVDMYVNGSNMAWYVWSFGDGSPVDSTTNNWMSHLYSALGTYAVSVRVYNFCGNDTVLTGTVDIASNVGFPSSVSVWGPGGPVCPGESANISADWGYMAYVWNYGDGSPPDSTNQSSRNHTYTTTGAYTVSVRIYNSCGKDTVVTTTVNVNSNQPVPNWVSLYIDPQVACPNEQIYMSASGGFLAYVWDFGDGSSVDSSSQNYRYHYFPGTGTFYPKVTIYNSCGNDTTLTDSVSIQNNVGFQNSAPYLNADGQICPGEPASMYVSWNSGSMTWFVWNYGDGTPVDSVQDSYRSHIYKNLGTYNVTVRVFNSCGEDTLLTGTVNVVNNAGFGPVGLWGPGGAFCPGALVNFNADYGYKWYVWNFGDGSPVDSTSNAWRDHRFNTAGTYTVSVRIYNYCGKDTLVSMTVNVDGTLAIPSPPPLNISPGKSVCPGQRVDFSTGGWEYQSFVWNYGDGSPVDSTFDSYRNHIYTATGTYTVTVKVYNYCGNSAIITDTIYVRDDLKFPGNDPNFKLNIYDSPACPGRRLSLNAPWGYQYYAWDYGDGSPVDTTTSSWKEHEYVATGTYNPTVTVINFCGYDTVLTGTVEIRDDLGFPVDPWFSVGVYPNNACPGQPVDLNAPYGYKSYMWNYGDGSPSDSTNKSYVTHPYSVSGSYSVSVKITNFCGRDTTIYGTVNVSGNIGINEQLSIYVDPTVACPSQEIYLSTQSGFQSYLWDFGDSTSLLGGSWANHGYDSTGTYVISVTMTNYCGFDTTISAVVTIDSNATFPNYLNLWADPQSGCPGDMFRFDTQNGFVAYYWDFGDGKRDTTTVDRINHSYDSLGNYSASVTILNGCGNTITLYRSVSVTGNAPVSPVDIVVYTTPACPGDVVLFRPENADGGGPTGGGDGGGGAGNYTYYWNFGDGTADTTYGEGPQHIYADTGTYTVTVKVINGCGKSATVTRKVIINNNAVPILDEESFGTASESGFAGCAGDAIVFYFMGDYPNNLWDFGDGYTAVATELLRVGDDGGFLVTIVKHAYSATGTYYAKLTITNACGNSVTDSVEVKIGSNLLVDGDMFIEPSEGNQGYTTCTPVKFIGFGGSSYFWTFGDGDTLTTISPSVEHTYLMPGNYAVSVKITNACGNSATYTSSLTISGIGGPVVNVSELSLVTCNGGSDGSAQAVPVSGVTPFIYVWGNGQTDATATGLSAGSYSVTITDGNGCESVESVTITEAPAIVITTGKVDAGCGLSDGSASASGSNGSSPYTYNWSTGSTNAIINSLAKGAYTVTVTDANGCSKTATVNISEAGAPALSTGSVTNVTCNGDTSGSATVNVSGGTPPFTYNWSDGQSSATATGLTAGNWLVTVTDTGGCAGVTSITITQPAAIQVSASTTKSNCGTANGSASVTVSGGVAPYTYQWSSGGTGTTESPLAAGTYTVTVTDSVACTMTKEITVDNVGSPQITNVISNVSCDGANDGAIDITVSGGTTPYFYNWSTGSNNQDISGLAPGLYTLILQDGAGCLAVRNFTVTEPDPVSSTIATTGALCGQSSGSATVTPAGGTQPYTYLWSNGATDASLLNIVPGSYTVTITDANGCTGTDTATVGTSVAMQEICVVTVDTLTEKNLVTWEKTPGLGTAKFYVYKESVTLGVYNLADSVNFSGVYSEYVDNASQPKVKSDRYKVAAVDSCGNESDISAPHKTMHLTSNAGISGEVNLIWENYEGMNFGSYIIWKSTNLAPVFVPIDTVVSTTTTYTDWGPFTGIDSVKYVVEVVHATGCIATAKTKNYNSSRSNKSSMKPPPDTGDYVIDVNRYVRSFTMYPNPNKGSFSYDIDVAGTQDVVLRLFNMQGQLVWSEKLGLVSGTVKREVTLERNLPGLYIMQVVAEGSALHRKLVVE